MSKSIYEAKKHRLAEAVYRHLIHKEKGVILPYPDSIERKHDKFKKKYPKLYEKLSFNIRMGVYKSVWEIHQDV